MQRLFIGRHLKSEHVQVWVVCCIVVLKCREQRCLCNNGDIYNKEFAKNMNEATYSLYRLMKKEMAGGNVSVCVRYGVA